MPVEAKAGAGAGAGAGAEAGAGGGRGPEDEVLIMAAKDPRVGRLARVARAARAEVCHTHRPRTPWARRRFVCPIDVQVPGEQPQSRL